MASYQEYLFNSQQQQPQNDNVDDMLLSSLTNDSHVMFKSAESMKSANKRRIQPPRPNNIIHEEENNSMIRDEMTSKKYNSELKELQLTQLNQQLKQQLIKQQQDFYGKELEFQQKLLQAQKQHDTMIILTKTKFEMIIEDLQSKLEQKNQEIIHLTSLFKQMQQEYQSQNQNKLTAKKLAMTEESIDAKICDQNSNANGFYTQRINLSQPKSTHSNNSDERLLQLYRLEIDKIKQQTVEFEMKFENEKKNIKQEINLLKNQKLVLQNLICQRSKAVSDKQSVVGSEHKTSRSKRESHSIQAYSHKSKKSFEF